jgi:hypothetical protein
LPNFKFAHFILILLKEFPRQIRKQEEVERYMECNKIKLDYRQDASKWEKILLFQVSTSAANTNTNTV